MRHARDDFNEYRERSLADIRRRIHDFDFSCLDPAVKVYQIDLGVVRIVCEQDLFVCDIEIRKIENKAFNTVGASLKYMAYIDGVCLDEDTCVYEHNYEVASILPVGYPDHHSMLDSDVKNSITRYVFSYYDMYRSDIEAAVKRKRLSEVSKKARMGILEDNKQPRREM